MKTLFRTVAMVIAILTLSSCATLAPPQSREFRLSEAQLQELVGRHFATAQKYLGVLDIKMIAPRVSLQPESNRVVTALDVALDAPLIGRPLKGTVSISGRLRFDHASNAILLEEPRADSFQVDGVPAIYADKVNLIGGWLSEQVLKGFTVYRLKPEDLRFENMNYSPSEFKVKPGELVISLVPKTTE